MQLEDIVLGPLEVVCEQGTTLSLLAVAAKFCRAMFSHDPNTFFSFVSFLFARTCLKVNLNRPRLLGRENEQSKKPTMRQDIFLMV